MRFKTFLASLIVFISFPLFAQELTVGVKVSEPFVVSEGDTFTGVSIDVWINTFDGISNYVEYRTVDELLAAVAAGEVDVAVAPITVTHEREQQIDFMFPYHQTGLTYAIVEDGDIFGVFMSVVPTILFGVFVIFCVMAAAGIIFAALEHKQNGTVNSTWKSIFTGIYWSSATITTVGYGDVSAQTTAGRFFSTIWMWCGLIIAGSLTGLIVSSVNVQTAGLEPFNILKADVAVVDGSAGLHYVEKLVQSHNIHVFETLDDAVQSVVSGKMDAVVHDEALLNHMSNTYPELYVSPETFNEDYYAFAVSDDWEYLEEFNVKMLENNEF